MNKFKYWFCIILWTFMPKSVIALDVCDIELTDVIKDARDLQMKVAKSRAEEISELENKNKQQENGEKSSEEKLNTKGLNTQDTN